MPRIASDKLSPGMTLAKPIVGKNGMTLLGEGTVLTEKWIERISDMDVEGIFIEGLSDQSMTLEEALAGLEGRFETVKEKPYMGLIEKAVHRHIESLYR